MTFASFSPFFLGLAERNASERREGERDDERKDFFLEISDDDEAEGGDVRLKFAGSSKRLKEQNCGDDSIGVAAEGRKLRQQYLFYSNLDSNRVG